MGPNVSKILVLGDFEFAAGDKCMDLNLPDTQHNTLARCNREDALTSTHAISFKDKMVCHHALYKNRKQ